ncbi:hypothetical protein ACLB2K_005097 [Fragaria x ananassa]
MPSSSVLKGGQEGTWRPLEWLTSLNKPTFATWHYRSLGKGEPTAKDRARGRPLAFREAVLLSKEASSPEFVGEVDDKYQYSAEDKDIKVHGWISMAPPVGLWMITPSDESRIAVGLKFQEGEAWKKVFGPVFVHLNSAAPSSHSSSMIRALWNNVKDQMLEEVKSWPYNFISSQDYPSSNQRGSVSGQLLVHDRYVKGLQRANSAYVGLAAPGEVGLWQRESKGYQYWTQTDEKGYFNIENVRPGHYRSKIELASITYKPPRIGPTLWEIGIPDRSAAEFYIPDPYPTLMNKLYKGSELDKFRQYGLWSRYYELYPHKDLIYNVGANNYGDDWFYAQVTRSVGNGRYVGRYGLNLTMWSIPETIHFSWYWHRPLMQSCKFDLTI